MIKDLEGHRERLRNRYSQGGYQAFHEYEILELLLTYTISRRDVKPIAKDLLKTYRSLEEIINSEIKELVKINGVGEKTAIFLKLLGDVYKNIYKNRLEKQEDIQIKSKDALINYLKSDIGFADIEEFKILFLNNSNTLVGTETLFYGTIDRSAVYPREIIKKVIEYKAKGVIFAHNHPSGNIRPSKKDIELTEHMERALDMLDVVLLDHIILSKDSYFSFREEGLMD